MRYLSSTLAICGLIAATVATGPASATPRRATDVSFSKAFSLQLAGLAMPIAGVNSVPAPYSTASDTALLFTDGLDQQGVAARPEPLLMQKGDLVAFSQSCTRTGFCCFWFMENHSPYCY